MKSLLATLLLLAPSLALASDLPSKPFIRIEIDRHTGPIHRIGVDAEGKWMVTGSSDKTARLWDLSNGKSIRVFRIPIGSGAVGRVLAVAMTQDGKTVAVGGVTDENAVYLFDRESGRMLRRLKGATGTVTELAFSADGARLVAGQAQEGIRFWRTKDGAKAGQDTKYKGAINGLSFDRTGRLVTSASDGVLRLYDAKGSLVRKAAAPGGSQPAGVQFSPDGEKISVGYNDRPLIEVLSSADFKLLYKPDVAGFKTSRLLKAVWSPDGQRLTAAGTANAIRSWSDGGRGATIDVKKGTQDAVTDIEATPDGFVYSAGDPAWAIFRADGWRKGYVGAMQADFYGLGSRLKISASAERIQFTIDEKGQERFEFDVPSRTLKPSPPEDTTLASARETAAKADFGAWKNKPDVTLNGKSLGLGNELTRTLAISNNGTFAVLGSDEGLRAFDLKGKLLWTRTVPGVPLSTNISSDGRVVVTAYADGTIRWQRVADGEELLAFFLDPKTKEWVCFTPAGHYEASLQGEQLFGWVKNRGHDASPEFLPGEQMRSKFLRGDVIALVLPKLEVTMAVEEADQKRYEEEKEEQ